MIRWAAITLIAVSLAGCAPASADTSRPGNGRAHPRVVSINPCVDAVLMQIADHRQIAAISHYSHDVRATSIKLDLARRFKATSGTAEEVVALAPDLVIAGGHVAPATIAALDRLRIPVIQIGVPEGIAESHTQIRTIAAAIGQVRRGERLVGRIDAAADAARSTDTARPHALIWQGGGMVPGDGTLAGELLEWTGYRNMSARYGLKKWDVLPLEHLVANPPRVLLSVGATRQSDRMLGHPVLDHLRQRIAVRSYPERLLHCGGPTIIDSLGHLASIRQSL